MSTYVEWLDGQVTLKNAADAEQFADELMDNAFPDCFVWKWERPMVMNIQSNGDTYFEWQQALSNTLTKYASAWDIEAKEECCDPVRLFKIGQNEGTVDGTQLIYYPGFEENFIQQLPNEVIKAFKGKGENPPIRTEEAHWTIDYPLGINGEHNFVCSSCRIHSWVNTEYCPHCGAKMAKGWKWKAEEAKQGSR